MNDVLLGALLALLGTVVGSLATLWTKKVELDSQSRAEEQKRLDESVQLRRETYTAFLAAATKSADASKEVSRASLGSPHEHLARRSGETWNSFLDAWASISLLAPENVQRAADDLREQVEAMVIQTDMWLSGALEWDDTVDHDYKTLESRRRAARDQFRSVAGADIADRHV